MSGLALPAGGAGAGDPPAGGMPAGGAWPGVRPRSAPLLPAALALLVGTALGPLLPPLPALALAPLAASVLLAAVATRRPAVALIGAVVWLGALGVVRVQGDTGRAPGAVAAHNGQFVELIGVVSEEPDVRDRSAIVRVRVQALATGSASHPAWAPASGVVQLRAPLAEPYAYGDRLDLRGRLEAPPILPDLDYRAFLARQGVGSVMPYPRITRLGSGAGDPLHAALYRLRAAVERNVEAALPQPEAALQRAVLIGTKSATFSTLTPDFIRTGMIHLIATSGFKVAIVGGWALGLAAPLLGRRRAAWPALAAVVGYIVLTGATPAGVRAGVMWLLVLGALLAGRPAASLQGLALAAAAMTALQPAVLGDTGFQLSAAATGGILLLQPRFAPWLQRVPAWIGEPVGVTAAAQLATLPVTMVGFHQVSLVSPLANLLCLPVLAASMAFGALLAGAQGLAPALAQVVAVPAYGLLAYMIGVVQLLARVPAAAVAAPAVGLPFATLYYAGLFAFLPLLPAPGARRHASRGGHSSLAMPAALALALGVALLPLLLRRPLTQTELTLLDAGQGDALLVRDPSGQTVLIDVGATKGPLLAQLGAALPFWQRSLSGVVLLGAEADHAGALGDLAARYTLSSVVLPAVARQPSQEAAALRRDLPASAITAQPPADVTLRTATGLALTAHPVGGATAPHLALFIRVGAVTLLDAAALSPADQHALLLSGAPLAAAVLVAPRGAAAGALDPGLLAAVRPAILLAAAPAAKAASADYPGLLVLRTDQLGPIRLLTDGMTISVE